MKSRDTLIRLKRFQAEEKRRRVAQIEAMIADFQRMASDLEREIVAEQERAGIHDPAHFAYPTYAKAAMARAWRAISRTVALPEPLSLIPGPSWTLSRCAPAITTLRGLPPAVSAITATGATLTLDQAFNA